MSVPKNPKHQPNHQHDVLEKRILEILANENGIKQAEIAASTGVGLDTVQRVMKQMTEKGIIIRAGGKRYGYWEIKPHTKRMAAHSFSALSASSTSE